MPSRLAVRSLGYFVVLAAGLVAASSFAFRSAISVLKAVISASCSACSFSTRSFRLLGHGGIERSLQGVGAFVQQPLHLVVHPQIEVGFGLGILVFINHPHGEGRIGLKSGELLLRPLSHVIEGAGRMNDTVAAHAGRGADDLDFFLGHVGFLWAGFGKAAALLVE